MTSYHLFKNTVAVRRSGVANSAGIIKLAISLIKRKALKFNKGKKNHKLCIKMQFVSLFPGITTAATF